MPEWYRFSVVSRLTVVTWPQAILIFVLDCTINILRVFIQDLCTEIIKICLFLTELFKIIIWCVFGLQCISGLR